VLLAVAAAEVVAQLPEPVPPQLVVALFDAFKGASINY